ncbi:polysaccharide pyruvyl transferase family protein [Clostridium sp. MSJ-8]|uniref:polysaccharide pyruvyl transferase family protein n=1 Tax=Clostridium sp. MSJ-8 TaxID=2841510 RepID=UPI001C0F16AE|nr:polysaccharide pyruvyl transferase family protein [Clostridium sp. MSJ-8]MBU5487102.1 polysaccharide pyruvyl transferase family protein [Clostridium sp. MSJ-8]
MNKVGLITYHAAQNNGSFLQAYALEKKISKIEGYKCDIINFYSYEQEELYSVFKKNNSFRNIAKNCVACLNYRNLKKRHDDFDNIVNNSMSLSKKCYKTLEELDEAENEYDIFVSGSDQIWNVDAWDYNDAYFLSFVNNKPKISYASSFGGKIDSKKAQNYSDNVRKFLNEYDSIAVREVKGQKYAKSLVDRDVQVVLDPTFLLDQQDYDKICADRLVEGDYIFFYSIDYNDAALKIVKKFAEINNLPVVVVYSGDNKSYKTLKYGFKMLKEAAPNHFLSLIKHAKYVLSTSFHGTVFSIIYNKQFFTVRGTENGKINNDDRLTTILSRLGLEDRQLSELSKEEDYRPSDIDYSIVNPKLAEARQESVDYLVNALNKASEKVKG